MSGETVYTDKRCEDVGGMDRLPRVASGGMGGSSIYRSGCSRTLSDLVYQITAAIEGAVEQAMARSGLGPDAIDRVFLTGGTSFVPAVRAISSRSSS